MLCVLAHITLFRKIRVVLGLRCCLSLLGDLFIIDSLQLDDLLGVLCRWPSVSAILLADGMRFLSMRARMSSQIFWSSARTFATYSLAYDACCSLPCFPWCVQFVLFCQQPQLQTELPSRSQPPSHVFRSSASFTAIAKSSSAICNCLLSLLLILCHALFFIHRPFCVAAPQAIS